MPNRLSEPIAACTPVTPGTASVLAREHENRYLYIRQQKRASRRVGGTMSNQTQEESMDILRNFAAEGKTRREIADVR